MLSTNTLTNFNSFFFLSFALMASLIFWILPRNLRSLFLLIINYLFYLSRIPEHLIILVATTIIDFVLAKKIVSTKAQLKRKILLFLSVFVNIGSLAYFKYRYLFFTHSPLEKIIIPLGISFFTLQSISYVFDVYRKKIEPEKSFIDYAVFISFFAQILAGPIEKAKHLIPQIKNKNAKPDLNLASYLFFSGFLKKFIVADSLAGMNDQILIQSSSSLLLKYVSLIFFFLRVYFDFSGYTDMARGTAYLFGINLIENFNFPLFSKSPSDFWKRWHMSLGDWVDNYFFKPLLLKTNSSYLTLLIVFPLMGLWHGISWLLLLWGLCWAIVIIVFHWIQFENFFHSNITKRIITLNICFLLIVFYKVNSLAELLVYLSPSSFLGDDLKVLTQFIFEHIVLLIILIHEYFAFKKNDPNYVAALPTVVKFIIYILIIFSYRHVFGIASRDFFYMQY